MARQFTKQWFGGSSDTKQQTKVLNSLLKEGLSILSGMQQPGHPDSEKAAQEEKMCLLKAEVRIKEIAADLYCALTGDEALGLWKETENLVWKDSRNDDKPESTEEISHRLAEQHVKEFLGKYFKEAVRPKKDTMSFAEMIMYSLILVALKRAEEQKFKRPEQQAAFITGFLASRVPFDLIDLSINKKKTKNSKWA